MDTNSIISRRQFLQILAVAGAAGCVAGVAKKLPVISKALSDTRLLMGTIVNLTVVADDPQRARAAIDATFERMMALETILSRHIPTSQLSQLNQNGLLLQAHPSLIHLVKQAGLVSEQTNGRFDISAKPLIDLYQQTKDQDGTLPTSQAITHTLSLVDYRNIAVAGQQIRLLIPGMRITLDGIAKGYIVDQGVTILRDLGFSNVLVEAGGDLLASGEKQAAQPWRVGIQSPRQSSPGLLERIDISNQAVCSSGDYMHSFSPDLLHHHIINPLTGYSSAQTAGASVLAPNCMLADAYATALMVLDIQAGINLIESLDRIEAYWVTKKMETIASSGFLT